MMQGLRQYVIKIIEPIAGDECMSGSYRGEHYSYVDELKEAEFEKLKEWEMSVAI